MIFSGYFYTKLFKKSSYIYNQHPKTWEKPSCTTENLSILKQGMPYLCNFRL